MSKYLEFIATDPPSSSSLSFDQSESTSTQPPSSVPSSGRHSIFSSRPSVPFLRRQARLPDVIDQSPVISPPLLSTNLTSDYARPTSTSAHSRDYRRLMGISGSSNVSSSVTVLAATPSRDHGLLTPPGPPPVLMSSSPQFYSRHSNSHNDHAYQQDHRSTGIFRQSSTPTSLPIRPYIQRPASLDHDNDINISRHSHLPELQFNSASFEEDETEINSTSTSNVQPCSTMHHILEEPGNEQQRMSHEMVEYLVPPSRYSTLSRAHTDPTSTSYPPRRTTPVSPPPAYGLPAYEEVVKEVRLKL